MACDFHKSHAISLIALRTDRAAAVQSATEALDE